MQHNHQRKPKTLIQYPRKIDIHHKLTYQLSRKYHFKHASSLKVSFQFSTLRDSYLLKKLKNPLIRLSKQLKSLRKLDLLECKIADVIDSKYMIQLVKAFRKIEHLSVPCYYINKQHTYSAIQWLKKSTKLRHFNSPLHEHQHKYGVNQNFLLLKNSHIKISKELRRNPIESIELSPLFPDSLPQKLRHIKKIALTPSAYSYLIKIDWNPEKMPLWLSNLQIIEILFPVKMSIVHTILTSIKNPNQTKRLAFRISNAPNLSNQNRLYDNIILTLHSFHSLKSFHISSSKSLPTLGFLEPLQKFPLEVLSLELRLDEGQLKILKSSLEEFHHLKALSLDLQVLYQPEEKESIISLMKTLGNLTQLEKLDLTIIERGTELQFGPEKIIDQVLISASESIANLSMLKELKLFLPSANFTTEFSHLARALKVKLLDLKRLEIEFRRKDISPVELLNFSHTFHEAKNLEILTLHGLKISDQNTFLKLARDLSKAKNLQQLRLDYIDLKIFRSDIVDALEIILQKKGLKTFELPSWDLQITQDLPLKFIRIKDVLQKNPNLKFIYLTRIHQDQFENLSDIQKYKWE